ncbi:hypothetical protein BOTBODRAFT_170757 [Botryobasidium botryosum FD-172 SS1]|uniref:Uncharacterized protein n=1 Tax=Botryobasidium botryosum (strain FD-172 SS1) TaxID=930990 RepID=A0A067N6D6_BOTB1|nr:hypothetical protein BOTBODRAFT_170757 [Botryobasidium botryosum FD-172 SS1]
MDVIPKAAPPPPASTTLSTYRQCWVLPQGNLTNTQTHAGSQLATSLKFIKGAFQAAVEFSSSDPDSIFKTRRNLFLGVLHVIDPETLSLIIANEPDFLEVVAASGIPPPLAPAAVPGPSKGKEREAPPASLAPTPKALPLKAKSASAAKPKPKTFATAAKAAPASAAVNPPKFNPSPKVASPMRAKRSGISSVAFKPATPIAPDAQASGYTTIQHVNCLLAPFHFQLKGLVWSPFGNPIATPNSPQFVKKSKEVLPGIFLDMFKVAFTPLSFDDCSNMVIYNLPLGPADNWTDPLAMASLLMAQNDITEPIPTESARWLANPAHHKGATASLRLSLPPQLRAAILKSGTLFLEGRPHPVRPSTAPKTLPNQCHKLPPSVGSVPPAILPPITRPLPPTRLTSAPSAKALTPRGPADPLPNQLSSPPTHTPHPPPIATHHITSEPTYIALDGHPFFCPLLCDSCTRPGFRYIIDNTCPSARCTTFATTPVATPTDIIAQRRCQLDSVANISFNNVQHLSESDLFKRLYPVHHASQEILPELAALARVNHKDALPMDPDNAAAWLAFQRSIRRLNYDINIQHQPRPVPVHSEGVTPNIVALTAAMSAYLLSEYHPRSEDISESAIASILEIFHYAIPHSKILDELIDNQDFMSLLAAQAPNSFPPPTPL